MFLGIFFTVIAIAPTIIFSGPTTIYRNYVVPSYFTAEDLTQLKYFKNDTITNAYGTYTTYDFNPQGVPYTFYAWMWPYVGIPQQISLARLDWQFWIWGGQHFLRWYTQVNSSYVDFPSLSYVLSAWDPESNVSSLYAFDNQITVKCFIADFNSTRNNITQSWNEGHLQLGIGFGLIYSQAPINSWDLIAKLLTFQAPQIFGGGAIGLAVNFMVALPIYGLIAYLIYRLVLMAIPFLGG
jgi:hypothetical protein